jgi:hypothetical protein
VPHAAELEHGDDAVVEAVTALAIEHRAAAIELHGDGDRQHRQRKARADRAEDHDLARA